MQNRNEFVLFRIRNFFSIFLSHLLLNPHAKLNTESTTSYSRNLTDKARRSFTSSRTFCEDGVRLLSPTPAYSSTVWEQWKAITISFKTLPLSLRPNFSLTNRTCRHQTSTKLRIGWLTCVVPLPLR